MKLPTADPYMHLVTGLAIEWKVEHVALAGSPFKERIAASLSRIALARAEVWVGGRCFEN